MAKKAISHRQITDLSSAVGLQPVPSGTSEVWIQPESQTVRFRSDGSEPTASSGFRLLANNIMTLDRDFERIRFIQEAASAKLNVTYFRD